MNRTVVLDAFSGSNRDNVRAFSLAGRIE